MALNIFRSKKPKSRYTKNKSSKSFKSRRFSGKSLLLFMVVFAGIGGFVLWKTFAATTISCFGAGVDPGYVAAFDMARSQTANNSVDYDQPRFYRGAQTWATKPGENPGHHSEHFHVEACIPNGVTMTQASWPLDIAYTFHNVDDYRIVSASLAAVRSTGESRAIWQATTEQLAQLQAAADASGDGSVQRVFFSVMTLAPAVNGWKEVRGGLNTVRDGPNAIFEQWHFDQRWYYTDNIAGLPAGTGSPPSQNAIRNRPIIRVLEDGVLTNGRYHHAGWCGFANAHLNPSVLSDCSSKLWTRSDIAQVWSDTANKIVTLYVTDGGGPATLMIDPDFHHHYDAPTAACPNVDADGNCLGKWVWRPSNARQELFSPPQQFPEVTIPASVIASLAPGLHKLVFRSDDAANCARHTPPDCDGTQRGTWSNVEVLPFEVGGTDSQAPSVPSRLVKDTPQPSSINIGWSPSTDNVAVAGYRVFRDGTQVLDVKTASAVTVSGLSAASHKIEVEAYDAAGNKSARAAVTVTRSWK